MMRKLGRSWLTYAAFGVVCLILCYVLVIGRRKEVPEFAVRSFFDCLDRRDAGCLFDLSAAEEAAGGMSRESWQRFVDGIWSGRMSGFRRTGELKFEPGTNRSVLSFGTVEYAHPDGRKVYVGAGGYVTEDKARIRPCFAPLLLALFQTYQAPGVDEPRRALYARALADLRPKLEQAGIQGVFLNTSSGDKYLTWDQWLAKLRPPPE